MCILICVYLLLSHCTCRYKHSYLCTCKCACIPFAIYLYVHIYRCKCVCACIYGRVCLCTSFSLCLYGPDYLSLSICVYRPDWACVCVYLCDRGSGRYRWTAYCTPTGASPMPPLVSAGLRHGQTVSGRDVNFVRCQQDAVRL